MLGGWTEEAMRSDRSKYRYFKRYLANKITNWVIYWNWGWGVRRFNDPNAHLFTFFHVSKILRFESCEIVLLILGLFILFSSLKLDSGGWAWDFETQKLCCLKIINYYYYNYHYWISFRCTANWVEGTGISFMPPAPEHTQPSLLSAVPTVVHLLQLRNLH